MGERKTTGYRIQIGNHTVSSESLAYVASHARAAALTSHAARIVDAEDRRAVITCDASSKFIVRHEPPLVLFPLHAHAPSWVQRLETLLEEHG